MTFEELNSLNISLDVSAGDQEEVKPTTPYLPFFRFTILGSGKIDSITFPKKFEKETLGLLKGFIKLFSPLLSASLYEEGQTVTKVKQDEDSTYQEAETYGFEKGSDSSTTLKNKGSVAYQGRTHNTAEESESSSKFSESGELESSNANVATNFSSVPEEPSDEYSTYSSDLSFTSHQEVDLNVLESFDTEGLYVQEFEQPMIQYEKSSDFYKMTTEELTNFVIGETGEEDEVEPGATRLLLNEDGSLTLFSYGKDVAVMKTNIVGMQIAAFGYTKIKFNLHQLKQKYKKEPGQENPSWKNDSST